MNDDISKPTISSSSTMRSSMSASLSSTTFSSDNTTIKLILKEKDYSMSRSRDARQRTKARSISLPADSLYTYRLPTEKPCSCSLCGKNDGEQYAYRIVFSSYNSERHSEMKAIKLPASMLTGDTGNTDEMVEYYFDSFILIAHEPLSSSMTLTFDIGRSHNIVKIEPTSIPSDASDVQQNDHFLQLFNQLLQLPDYLPSPSRFQCRRFHILPRFELPTTNVRSQVPATLPLALLLRIYSDSDERMEFKVDSLVRNKATNTIYCVRSLSKNVRERK
jgi:hypothetical protein